MQFVFKEVDKAKYEVIWLLLDDYQKDFRAFFKNRTVLKLKQ